jgi:hypothetical protein
LTLTSATLLPTSLSMVARCAAGGTEPKQLNQTGDVMAAENLLKVWPHLRENDHKIIKVAVDKCGSKYNLAPTTERALFEVAAHMPFQS